MPLSDSCCNTSGVEAQTWDLAGKLRRCGEGALLGGGIRVRTGSFGSVRPPLLVPVLKYWGTTKHVAKVITRVVMNAVGESGVYYDDEGNPLRPSAIVRDPNYTARVVKETRALLATNRT